MADKKFEAILTLLVPQVVQLICENYPVDEMAASREFYESKVYSLLEQEMCIRDRCGRNLSDDGPRLGGHPAG